MHARAGFKGRELPSSRGHTRQSVRIAGHVQGVGFRAWTARQADGLGLEGWVGNQQDGSVHAMIVGSDQAVAAMLEAFMHGPDFATVTDVMWHQTDEPDLSGFRIVS